MEAVKKAHGYPSTTTPLALAQSPTLSVSVTESVSVTSVRAMCLYLDNHSISTINENELVYLPTGDTDRPNTVTDKAQPTRLRPCCCLYSRYHKCLSPTLHYISVCYTINKLTNCVSLCYLFDTKMMFSFNTEKLLSEG